MGEIEWRMFDDSISLSGEGLLLTLVSMMEEAL
jgi:hypothetical protein